MKEDDGLSLSPDLVPELPFGTSTKPVALAAGSALRAVAAQFVTFLAEYVYG